MSTQSEHSMPIVPVSSDIPTVENINRTPTEAEWKILDWMLTKMSANPRKKSTIDSILRWNYYGGVGEPFYKDFFHKEKTWEEINGIDSKIISNRGYAYKRAYKNAVKKGREMLSKNIGKSYEILQGEWINFEDFKGNDSIERLWEKFLKYARAYTENDDLLVSDEVKESICADFTKHLNVLLPIIKKYDVFFHNSL
ncbi:5130_t:CDS:2 [Entrophospora sp. SA101]|nr:5130_t:CDS:2 [Entrophospora sp. SA101]